MSPLAARLRERFYRWEQHPFHSLFERHVESLLSPSTDVLLDAGCGRAVPLLRAFLGKVRHLIGVDLVEFTDVPAGIAVYQADLSAIPVADGRVDVVMSRSVFEHLSDPISVYGELARVVRPGGKITFLTANMWDYGTLIARLVPNRFHAGIVKAVEGREAEDTFPTVYRSNTHAAVTRLAAGAGLRVVSFKYLSQYPNYLMFNGVLFFLGMCYEKLINRFDALRFLRGWILVTLEKPEQYP